MTQVTISGPDKAIENDTTVLNCNSDGTKVFYHWLEGNQSLGGHIFLSNDNKTLTFNPTLRDDSGNYTCYGNNGVSEASATYSLNVLCKSGFHTAEGEAERILGKRRVSSLELLRVPGCKAQLARSLVRAKQAAWSGSPSATTLVTSVRQLWYGSLDSLPRG